VNEEILTQRDQPVDDLLDLSAVAPPMPGDDLLGPRPISIGD
jgi:hypothetical protein